ncbi:MAG: GGDEF-domain containing protein [Alphaproteobacteria bacterium 64-6]|nr:MAG: GGDEF-domain containing protein [Alphaproteobacteria bacterium 64-6]
MNIRLQMARLARLVALPADNPELVKAQFAALSRLIPLMYFILIANSWVLTATFFGKAPAWLTIHVSLALSVICAVRLIIWWRKKHIVLTAERAVRELRRTNRIAAALCIAFPAWAFALYPYANELAQGHIAFFLTLSLIGTMLCLLHTPATALIVAVTVGTTFVAFIVSTGEPTFIGMAVNALLVTCALLVVVLIQSRDFARMVNAQTYARRREQEQSRLLRMIDDMPVAVMTVEPDTLIINYANETSKQLIGSIEHLLPIKADTLVGTCIDVFHRHPEHQRKLLADPANLPHKARIKLGPEVLDLQVSAVNDDDGSYIGPMLSWAIVTKEVEAENRIRHLAHYDTLTGLPNRTTFHEQLAATFATRDNRNALLFIDLDGFKLINDTQGHRVGDLLLQQVANRLRAACTAPGVLIGRLGGDEFAVLLPHDNADETAVFADALVESLGAPYHLDVYRRLQIGASIGIALAPAHGDDHETLLSRADIALYAAKSAGKCTFRVFTADMETRIQERVRLEAKLRSALETQEGFFVFYQSIIDIESGKVTAREALVRWHHPERGWVSPVDFVPVAEESGLIEPLGQFVLNRACRDAAEWKDGARVAVNISAGQLGKGTLPSTVLSALAASGLSPGRLEIEVTETALLNEEAGAIGDLRRLRDMGVRVALDDFGTGYSSLSHLRTFSFDKIKIDSSFVRDAVARPDCAAVIGAVAAVAKRLGVTTVAEGVETQEHLDRVRAEGCTEVQGYLYSRPMPSERDVPIVAALNQARQASSAA